MSRFATPSLHVPPTSTPSLPALSASSHSNQNEPENSMSSDLAAPIKELGALTQALFASLAPPSTRPPPPPSVQSLIAADEALRIAVKKAREHQIRQRKIERLEDDILMLDARWRAVCAELEQGRIELGAIIDEGGKRVANMKLVQEAAVPLDDLLAYAKAVSAYSAAPPGLSEPYDAQRYPQVPGIPLLFPPFPTDEKMALGRLGNQDRIGPSGETVMIGQPPEPEAPQQAAEQVHNYRPDVRPRQQIFDLDLDLNPDL